MPESRAERLERQMREAAYAEMLKEQRVEAELIITPPRTNTARIRLQPRTLDATEEYLSHFTGHETFTQEELAAMWRKNIFPTESKLDLLMEGWDDED